MICASRQNGSGTKTECIERHLRGGSRCWGSLHETLRKLHRYKYSIDCSWGRGQADHPDSVKIAFDTDELRKDLLTVLETEGASALATAAQDTLDSVGYRDPWKLPAQDTLDFIARRQNLLSNVPDEIFDTIRNEISEGLNQGESTRELSKRISNAFDEIGKGRAQVIAQTETAAAYSFASDARAWWHSIQTIRARLAGARPDAGD